MIRKIVRLINLCTRTYRLCLCQQTISTHDVVGVRNVDRQCEIMRGGKGNAEPCHDFKVE